MSLLLSMPSAPCPAATASATSPAAVLRDAGRLHAPINEASALVQSRTAPALFWTLNDSLNPPYLYVVNATGRCFAAFEVKADNLDWEALAIDDHGNLYIGDIGNNEIFGNHLATRRILRLREPDLRKVVDRCADKPAHGTLEIDATYSYTFPAKPFDAEAMFIRRGNLYLVSKVRSQPTRLYQADISEPTAGKPLKEICTLPEVYAVTDASLSADSRRLAICSYNYVAVFTLDPAEPIENLERRKPAIYRFKPTSTEGCSWNGSAELILVAEGGPIYKLHPGTPSSQPMRKAE